MRSPHALVIVLTASCAVEPELAVDEFEQATIPCTHYVALTGVDAPGNGTAAMPWRTIHYAVNHVGPGARVCVRPGTYDERVDFGVSGTAAAPITLTSAGGGEVIVNGTVTDKSFGACPPTLGIYGSSHLRISNLTITNQGNAGYPGVPSDCQATGMLIMPGGRGDVEDVIVGNCVFRDIAPVRSDQLGLPLGFGSYVPGLSVYNIQLTDNVFRDNDTINEGMGYWVGAVAVVGDAHDFLIARNVFDDPDTGGVETAGNQGNDLQPMGGVISDNQFLRSGSVPPYHHAGVYLQGAVGMLVERNYFDRTGIGVSIHTEPPYVPPGTKCPFEPRLAGASVVRDNILVNTVFQDFRTGANNNQQPCNYASVDSVYVTNNTIYRPNSAASSAFLVVTNPTAGLIGDNKFLDNIIITKGRAFEIYGASTPIEIDHNYVVSPVPQPVFWDVPMTWSAWQAASHDVNSRFGTAIVPTTFVSAAPVDRADFALSADTTTPPHDGGKPRLPFHPPPTDAPWAWFGIHGPTVEYDAYWGSRDHTLRRDIGADEW